LQQYTETELHDFFPKAARQTANLEDNANIAMLEAMQNKILALTPASGSQTWLQAQALSLTSAMISTRWQLGQENLSRFPRPILVLMMF
jgi:hypothetical protein